MNASGDHATMTLPFETMSDAEAKTALSTYSIGLTVEEARKIQEMLGRAPTLVEATIWGIQGSEHCSYKSSRRFLKQFPTSGKHVILGPGEDSGIVAITEGPPGKRWGIVVSHESHNHPSQIVPFEGAATGVGGTVRDVVCMGARVVGCMDMLRLGDLKTKETKTIAREVVRGIGGYGNPLGIPNLGGDTVFDSAYNTNCLVNAVAIGIVREDEIIHSFVPEEAGRVGYDIILVGKPTDRSGFGGAAFASVSMEEEKREQNSGAVQEPNPFLERHLLASTYALFDTLISEGNLSRVSFKDLGAGGVVCSSVEQVAHGNFGARVNLDDVHVSIEGLPPEVIACAETQERFCWICHPDLTQQILEHYNVIWDLPTIAKNARASVIGKVTDDGIYQLTHNGKVVCEAKSTDITSGLQYVRPTKNGEAKRIEPPLTQENAKIRVEIPGSKVFETTLSDTFKAMVAHPNHASKKPAFLHFDKTVIGNTVIEAGEADASVITPLRDLQSYLLGTTHPGWELEDSEKNIGAVFAGDGNSRYGKVSAYLQGANAAVEAMCNVAAVGGIPRALTDCLNYGNPELPEHLAALEDGVRGITDAAKGLGSNGQPVPVISGNVSLYNSLPDGSAIPPTAIVCCVGVMSDASKAVTMQLKKPGSVLALLGQPEDECGASALYEILESMGKFPEGALLGQNVPSPRFEEISKRIAALHTMMEAGLILSSHDISDGGLLLALFEMTLPQRGLGGTIGAFIDTSKIESSLIAAKLLFSESQGFLIEIERTLADQVKEISASQGIACHFIGESTKAPVLEVIHGESHLLKEELSQLNALWEGGLASSW